VDENQHRSSSYTPECDMVREFNLAQANGIPTVFLRYNPDPFKDTNGKKHNPTRRQRMDELLKWVGILTQPTIEKRRFFASKVMLFFDGFESRNDCEQCVIPWDDNQDNDNESHNHNENDEQMEQQRVKKQKTN
jgi:hypothetical protein